jgi:membrane AbrB-like protein
MTVAKVRLARLGILQWPLMIGLAVVLSLALGAAGINAAMFMGPLLGGLIFAFGGSDRMLPQKWTIVSQALIGCVVARSLDADVLGFVGGHILAVAFVVLATAVISIVIAIGLVRFGGMDAETAAWGAMPGAAGIMVAFAADYGGDARLVAFMQYVRLIVIIAAASVVTSLMTPDAGPGTADAAVVALRQAPPGFGQVIATLAVAVAGTVLGRVLRIPAGPLLFTAVLGAVLRNYHVVDVALPYWLLAFAYGLLGLFVGLQFDGAVVEAALRRLPIILVATAMLAFFCAAAGFGFAVMMGVDHLTGYLATTPGAIDSIAVLALGATGNLSVVMAVQAIRFFFVILMAPALVRIIRYLTGSALVARPS